jgi:hypothetical protein
MSIPLKINLIKLSKLGDKAFMICSRMILFQGSSPNYLSVDNVLISQIKSTTLNPS